MNYVIHKEKEKLATDTGNLFYSGKCLQGKYCNLQSNANLQKFLPRQISSCTKFLPKMILFVCLFLFSFLLQRDFVPGNLTENQPTLLQKRQTDCGHFFRT